MKLICLCTLSLLVGLLPVKGISQIQKIQFQHLTMADGLSDNHVVDITQDKLGFIWIATLDGLNRFDGYRVDVFSHIANDPTSLIDDYINCLYVDSKGELWVGTYNGLSLFNFSTNSFVNFKHEPGSSNSLPSNAIRKIIEDAHGVLWIGTDEGLCSFDLRNKKIVTFIPEPNTNSISNKNIFDIAKDRTGNLWITTANGLNRLNPFTLQFSSWFHNAADDSSLSGNSLQQIAVDHEGSVWVATSENVVEHFNPTTGHCRHYAGFNSQSLGYSTVRLEDFFVDFNDQLWIASGPLGCCIYEAKPDSFRFIKNDPFVTSSIASNAIRCFFQDRDKVLYIGGNNGVDRFNPSVKKFDFYLPFDSVTFGNWVRAFCEDHQRRLWVATNKGIVVMDREHGTIIRYRNISGDPGSLTDNSVRSLCCDRNGTIWVGTANGLARFNATSNTFKTYKSGRTLTSLPGGFIMSIITDHLGNLWIGTSGGFCRYNYATDDFVNFIGDSSREALNSNISAIYEDAAGNLWIGTPRYSLRLLRYNPSTNSLTTWKYDGDDSGSYGGNTIYSITQDLKDVIWIGTSGGLSRYDESTNRFVTLTTKNGLPNNHVADLLVDKSNNLWMGTDNGLCMLNATRTTLKPFDIADGLQGKEFNTQAGYITHDGYFCYAGYNGFNMFNPDSLRFNTAPPVVVLRSFKIFDRSVNADSLVNAGKSIHLTYAENFFTFEFAALSYDHPEKNQYACQLIGFDSKPIQLGNEHRISYTNVPPGNYTLKIIATNNDGVWNEKGASIQLFISPPFWRTWWFYILSVVIIAAILYGLYRIRINKIMAVQRVRNLISRDLHDDVGSTLTGIIMMSEIGEQSAQEKNGEAASWLQRIGNNSKEMMDNMRDIVWSINPSKDVMHEIVARMKQYAAQLLEPNDTAYFFYIDERVFSLHLDFIYKRNLYLIFKEALANASKYANCTEVKIHLFIKENNLNMRIEDNGKGFDAAVVVQGNGLRNMQQRVLQINGKLLIESVVGKGTGIVFTAPLTRIRYLLPKRFR